LSSEELILTIFACIPILAFIIGFGMMCYGGKDSLEQQSFKQIKKAKPYADVQNASTYIDKKNFYILFWYILYFVIIIPILVHFFGKITYGPNLPYILLVILTGIPFLAAFIHIFAVTDRQRYRLIASGLSIDKGSEHVIKWMFLVTCITVLLVYYTLKLSNKFIP